MTHTLNQRRRHFSISAISLGWIVCILAGPALARPVGDMSRVGPHTEKMALEDYTRIVYVSATSGSDARGDGSSEQPWSSVSAALEEVKQASPHERVAVLIAAGVYQGQTLTCRSFVDLYGGFSPDTWQRDIFAYETVLDGQQARRVLVGANQCRIDGFVIRNGRAFGPGGGLFCDDTSPVVTNNRFLRNHTLAPADVHPDRIHQEGNRGGALAAWFDAAPIVRNNVFSENWTEIGDGGAVAIFGWSRLEGRPQAVIEDNVFLNNRSGTKDYDRTRSSSGGAIACSREVDALIRNNVIAHNRALGNSDAGGIYVEFYSSPEIRGNWIVGNEGDDDGGGIYAMRDGEPLVKGNLIAGNWTTGGGIGGIRLSKEGRMRLLDNIIVQNRTGGGVGLYDGFAVVEGNLIAENKGGPGLYYRQNLTHYQPSVIRSNRIYGNESGQITINPSVGAPPILEGNSEQAAETDIDAPGLDLVIRDANLDERLHQTELVVEEAVPRAGLVGRAMRIGNRWSVIQSASGNTLRVWGDFTADDRKEGAQSVTILPDHSLER